MRTHDPWEVAPLFKTEICVSHTVQKELSGGKVDLGVTLVNKTMWNSGAQFHNTASGIVCSPPRPSLLPSPCSPLDPLPPPPSRLIITVLLSVSMRGFSFLFCFIPSPFITSPPTPSPLTAANLANLFSASVSLFLFCLLVYFVHLTPHVTLDPTWHLATQSLLTAADRCHTAPSGFWLQLCPRSPPVCHGATPLPSQAINHSIFPKSCGLF